jgi:hypothetical protein
VPKRLGLLTLKEAAALLHGKVTVGSLRRAGHEGRLHIIRLGARHYTTEAALADMLAAPTTEQRQQCQDPGRNPGSTFVQPVRDDTQPSSFATDRVKLARDAALMSVSALRKPSKRTKSPDIDRPEASQERIISSFPKR